MCLYTIQQNIFSHETIVVNGLVFCVFQLFFCNGSLVNIKPDTVLYNVTILPLASYRLELLSSSSGMQ